MSRLTGWSMMLCLGGLFVGDGRSRRRGQCTGKECGATGAQRGCRGSRWRVVIAGGTLCWTLGEGTHEVQPPGHAPSAAIEADVIVICTPSHGASFRIQRIFGRGRRCLERLELWKKERLLSFLQLASTTASIFLSSSICSNGKIDTGSILNKTLHKLHVLLLFMAGQETNYNDGATTTEHEAVSRRAVARKRHARLRKRV